MDVRTLVRDSKPRLLEVANLLMAGKQTEAVTAFARLVSALPRDADPRTRALLAGLVVGHVSARKNPPVPTLRKFEDPLTAFEDPLTAFEDPLTAFEDPLTAFGSAEMVQLARTLLVAPR
ncbi:MAG: hypothetical protein GX657_08565 [Chloroflexi bacterium]|nr:hypothetical protein [Chloroflexota bacterium]